MSVQRSLIRNLYFTSLNLAIIVSKQTKNICWAESEDAVNHSTVTRWFKIFCSACKNLNDQVRASRPKTVDSEAVLRAMEANSVSSIQRVLGELDISPSSLVRHL